jgi:hypothetical protein
MADIFISYARDDLTRVELLAKALEDQGWSVWWDRTIPVGKTWDDVIEEEIDAAKCIVVVWSDKSVTSGWVRTEAEEGLRRNALVPVLIDNAKIPLRFRSIQAASLIAWHGDVSHKGFQKLVQALASNLGSPPKLMNYYKKVTALQIMKQQMETMERNLEQTPLRNIHVPDDDLE